MIKQNGDEVDAIRIRIELEDIAPPIWRLVCVPRDLSLGELHDVVQAAMGWAGYHMHEFRCQGRRVGVPDEDGIDDPDVQDEEDVFLMDVLKRKGAKIQYMYDFGDDWCHTITYDSRAAVGDELFMVLDGARACPPEDCGGPFGYQEVLEIIADPENDGYDEMMDWLGEDFDPEVFDPEEATDAVRELQEDGDFDADLDLPVYDAESGPDPEEWLEMDEGERAMSVQIYHDLLGDEPPNPVLHATMHTIVENQLAEGLFVVHKTLKRLQDEGLDRHDAIHAIGSVVAEQIQGLMSGQARPTDGQKDYFDRLSRLTAESWLKQYEE